MNNKFKFQNIPSQFTFLVTAVIICLFYTSCNDDEKIAKPTINNVELGLSDSHVAYIGSDFHIEAEIVAEGKIDVVTVEMHKEEGSEYEIKTVFNEFSGLKNATLHSHIDIPKEADTGTYHLHLIIIDKEGNQTSYEDEISIKELIDEQAAALNFSLAPESKKNFRNKESVSVNNIATKNNSLSGMLLALVKKGDNLQVKAVTEENS